MWSFTILKTELLASVAVEIYISMGALIGQNLHAAPNYRMTVNIMMKMMIIMTADMGNL
jgi:hypothetical protein